MPDSPEFTPAELRQLLALKTPAGIQRFLDAIPYHLAGTAWSPRKVLREFGTELPDDMAIRVHDSLADLRYLVLPNRPAGTEHWSKDKLVAIVSRDCMVGVANPQTEDGR